MKNVFTGEVKFAKKGDILVSNAIGSCIVIVFYDNIIQLGGMAHIMLPGKPPPHRKNNDLRYAENAIQYLLDMFHSNESENKNIFSCIIGAGNVLKRADDNICQHNIHSVQQILNERSIPICKESLGGVLRRSARLDISTGKLFYTEGDSKEKLLHNFLH